MRDDPSVTRLVASARVGDNEAWDALVERYAPLIWSICRRYRLTEADAADVGQNVWLCLAGRWTNSVTRPHSPAGWLPPPSGNAAGRCGPHVVCKPPGTTWTSRPSRTRRP